MKHRLELFVAVTLLFLCSPELRAQSLDEQYVRIYNVIQRADAQLSGGQATAALSGYVEAQTALKRIQQTNPDWNQGLVSFRLDYLGGKISGLTGRAPVTAIPAGEPPKSGEKPADKPVTTANDQQISELREQVRLLQSDKIVLEAKLKESLAAQPAAIDPRELAKAETRVSDLTKENELLKTSLEEEKAKPAVTDTAQVETARAEAAEANRKLAEQIQFSKSLASDNQALQSQLTSVTAAAGASDALRAENELLKRQLNEFKSTKPSKRVAEADRKAKEAEARYAALSSDMEILRLERDALQNQVRNMTNTVARAVALRQEDVKRIQTLERERSEFQRLASVRPGTVVVTNYVATTNRVEDTARVRELEKETADLRAQLATRPLTALSRPEDTLKIKQLEMERDQFRKDLDIANRKLASREGRAAQLKIEQLTTEIDTLKARVQVFEARSVPYSQEELALFKSPVLPPAPRAPGPEKISSRELPAGGSAMAAEAQRQFANKNFVKAEESYQQILKLDDKNAYTLANLAAIQMEQGKLEDAEKNLRKAVDVAPQDAYSVSLLGILSFRRGNYDEALDVLSKAAKLDSQNAEVQNYLGITLSQKGLRGPAETALRKAIELDPSNGSAHNNLAVLYLSQNPPLVELARWHYQKALAAKHPRNVELEKMLEEKKAK